MIFTGQHRDFEKINTLLAQHFFLGFSGKAADAAAFGDSIVHLQGFISETVANIVKFAFQALGKFSPFLEYFQGRGRNGQGGLVFSRFFLCSPSFDQAEC